MLKRITIFTGVLILLLAAGVFYSEQSHAPESSPQASIFEDLSSQLPKEENLPEPFQKTREYIEGSKRENLYAKTIIALTNQERRTNGQLPLAENTLLNAAAEEKISDMFKQQYFEHKSPDGKGPADIINAAGYEYIIVGENLAEGDFKTNAELIAGWMNSPGHRENILHPKYTEIGVAVRKGMFKGAQVWMAVQEFGRPLRDCPTVDEGIKTAITVNETRINLDQSRLQVMSEKMAKAQRDGDINAYNAMVAPYNELVNQVNLIISQTKELVAKYNTQVQQFNACIT